MFNSPPTWSHQASELDLKEPKYTSNLSAAFYEEGKYEQCVESIGRSWEKIQDISDPLKDDTQESLSIKLSTRLAKANLQLAFPGPFVSDVFDKSNLKDVLDNIEKYVEVKSTLGVSGDVKIRDMVEAWDQWTSVRSNVAKCTPHERRAKVSDGLRHFRAANIFKCTSYVQYPLILSRFSKFLSNLSSDPTLEFYTVSSW